MSSFTKAFPTFKPSGNGYEMTESFEYYTTISRKGALVDVTIKIHAKFYTDLMSGPEWLKNTIGLKREDYAAASIVHDHLYRYRIAYNAAGAPLKLTRKESDYIMKEAMLVLLSQEYNEDLSLNELSAYGAEYEKIDKVYGILRTWGWFAWFKWRFKGMI